MIRTKLILIEGNQGYAVFYLIHKKGNFRITVLYTGAYIKKIEEDAIPKKLLSYGVKTTDKILSGWKKDIEKELEIRLPNIITLYSVEHVKSTKTVQSIGETLKFFEDICNDKIKKE